MLLARSMLHFSVAMHPRTSTKPAVTRHQPARRTARETDSRDTDTFASDPGDPVQGLGEAAELQGTPLEVDAQSIDDAVAAQDLATLESEIDELAGEDDRVIAMAGMDASSEEPPTDDLADAKGQNWVEALETSAIENGADPERELELDDLAEGDGALRPPRASGTRDTPVADYGSGGRDGR
jgi:hypothetical protein